VATPFYGYGGQIHRWFEGESLLNHLGKNKIDIIKTLSSLPSSYTLNWLAEDTFNAMRERLWAGDFAIQDYPSKDRADPYNPPDPDRDGKVRYATHLGFSIDELKLGRDVCKQLAADLPDDLVKKFFNIRGVQTGFDLETPLKQTICGTSWQLIDSNFDPRRQDSPVTDDLGAGDEVLAQTVDRARGEQVHHGEIEERALRELEVGHRVPVVEPFHVGQYSSTVAAGGPGAESRRASSPRNARGWCACAAPRKSATTPFIGSKKSLIGSNLVLRRKCLIGASVH
jgi:hypothetical protein